MFLHKTKNIKTLIFINFHDRWNRKRNNLFMAHNYFSFTSCTQTKLSGTGIKIKKKIKKKKENDLERCIIQYETTCTSWFTSQQKQNRLNRADKMFYWWWIFKQLCLNTRWTSSFSSFSSVMTLTIITPVGILKSNFLYADSLGTRKVSA